MLCIVTVCHNTCYPSSYLVVNIIIHHDIGLPKQYLSLHTPDHPPYVLSSSCTPTRSTHEGFIITTPFLHFIHSIIMVISCISGIHSVCQVIPSYPTIDSRHTRDHVFLSLFLLCTVKGRYRMQGYDVYSQTMVDRTHIQYRFMPVHMSYHIVSQHARQTQHPATSVSHVPKFSIIEIHCHSSVFGGCFQLYTTYIDHRRIAPCSPIHISIGTQRKNVVLTVTRPSMPISLQIISNLVILLFLLFLCVFHMIPMVIRRPSTSVHSTYWSQDHNLSWNNPKSTQYKQTIKHGFPTVTCGHEHACHAKNSKIIRTLTISPCQSKHQAANGTRHSHQFGDDFFLTALFTAQSASSLLPHKQTSIDVNI